MNDFISEFHTNVYMNEFANALYNLKDICEY